MHELALLFGRQRRGIHLGDVAVHIPFHVRNIVFAQYLADDAEHVVDDLLAREIEHELISAAYGFDALFFDRPIGVRAVKIAVLGNHFGFKPQPEFQSSLFTAVDHRLQAAFEFVLVDEPIAQSRTVVVALAEPTVV